MTKFTKVSLASLMLLALVGASHQQETGANGAPADYNIGKDECILPGNEQNLLETAKSAEDFSTLVAALESVPELLPIFESKSDKLTVLAPTNAAFDSFFSDFNSTAEEFLADKDLTTLVLSYHVIPSVVPKDDMESALKPLFMSQVSQPTQPTEQTNACASFGRQTLATWDD